MNEATLRNESLGLSMTKATINGIDVVLAENVREALEWDRIRNMVRGLKNGKEVLKIRVSDLDSTLKELLPNLGETSEKGGRPQEYVYFLTRQGVARLIATRRPHDIKDNPELADKLDKLRDWIFREVLLEDMATGRYSGKPLVAGQHAITEMPTKLSDALRLMADEWDAHELTMGVLTETTAQRDEAIKTVEKQNSIIEKQNSIIEKQNRVIEKQNSTIREQQSRIEWIDDQRISMAESCARFSPVKDKPCDDAKAVRGHWQSPAKCADGEFDVRLNDEYNAMIRRAIRERSLMDYELIEFKTVIEADDIKGTKHTKDECTLLDMYNSGRIGIIPTII